MTPQELDGITYSIFDTETTGLDPQMGDRIVELAAIKFKQGRRVATFQTLINPLRPISEAAFRVNNITAAMLKNAPPIEKILPDFLDFIKDSCLCSYNASFDLEFLSNESRRIDKSSWGMERSLLLDKIIVIDILKMARRLLPGLERYALWFVAERLGLRIQQQHRALQDTELTLAVFNNLINILKAKGIANFDSFVGLFGINSHFLENLNNQKLAKIQEAIDLGVKIKIKYLSSTNAQVSQRQIIPKHIKQDKNRNYLIGHCLLKSEERTFNIDGILHLEII